MLTLSFGPFVTCFITSIVLAGYLYVVLHKSKSIFKCHIRIVFIIIAIIMVRMLLPINFPFTYTVFVKGIFKQLVENLYMKLSGNLYVIDILLSVWFLGAFIAVTRYTLKRRKIRQYLEKCILSKTELESFNISHYFLLSRIKNIRIAVIPDENTPAIFGVIHPIIIFPNDYCMYDDLDFVISHEIQHYHNYDLFLKYILDLWLLYIGGILSYIL